MRVLFLFPLIALACASAEKETAEFRPSFSGSSNQETERPMLQSSLSLADALHKARENSPALRAMAYQKQAQIERLSVAGRWKNPEIGWKAEGLPLGTSGGKEEVLLGVRQAIPLGGVLSKTERLEEEKLRSLQHRQAFLTLELDSRVRGLFASALVFQEVVVLQEQRVEIAKKQSELQEALVESGEEIGGAWEDAKMEQFRQASILDETRRRHQIALGDLALFLNVSTSSFVLRGDVEEVVDFPKLEILLRGLEQVPVLAEAFSSAQVAKIQADLAEARMIPAVHLELFYRKTDTGHHALDAGVFFELPWNGQAAAQSRAQSAEASAAMQKVQWQLQETRMALRRRYTDYTLASEQWKKIQEEVIPALSRKTHIAELQYQAGEYSLTEVLRYRTDWVNGEIAQLNAWKEVLLALAHLRPFLLSEND